MNLEPGARLGTYEITDAIGEGGMGRVYRARDTVLGRNVAIKVLPPEVAEDADRVTRFEREARLSSSLNHPSIVTIFGFERADGTAFIAMELVGGESLRATLSRKKKLPWKTAMSIASQMAAGLAAAHRVGIVHRDLKPENVMVTPQGLVKILDFGLAKAIAPTDEHAVTEQHLTAPNVVVGTVAYMSPEQLRGGDVDYRTDQYAFGLMVYEMLTGRIPKLDDGELPPLPEASEELTRIVERCLQNDRELRYGSTDDLAVDMMHVREQKPERRVVPASRRPFWVAAGSLALAAILLALLIAKFRAPLPLRAPAYVALQTSGLSFTHAHNINSPVAISPDARRIVMAATDGGLEKLWLRDLSSSTATPIAGTEGAYAPSWSRDGKQIAFFAGGKLKVVAVDGGAPRILCDAYGETSPSWNEAGVIVFTQINPPGIYKVDSRGGAATRLTAPDGKQGGFAHVWPEFLPDGKRFLFIGSVSSGLQATSTQLTLLVGSLDGAAPQRVGTTTSRVVYRNGTAYYVRDGALVSQPFDDKSLGFSEEPSVITDKLDYLRDSASASFSVADNGSIVYVAARGISRLLVVDREGQQLSELGRSVFRGPGRLAPDGNRFATCVMDMKLGLCDLWVFNLSGRAASRLTFDTFDEWSPVWSRDGRSLYYMIDIAGPPDIFKLDVERNRREPVVMTPGRQDSFDLSRDILLFGDFNRAHAMDLYTLRLTANAKPESLVATPFDEKDGRFSPDGRWVSYTSDVSGKPEVYVVRFPHGAPIRVSSNGGSNARWRADGSELTFLSAANEVTSVTFDGGDFGTPRFLFRLSEGIESFEMTSDGRRFIVQTNEIDPPPPVQLVLR